MRKAWLWVVCAAACDGDGKGGGLVDDDPIDSPADTDVDRPDTDETVDPPDDTEGPTDDPALALQTACPAEAPMLGDPSGFHRHTVAGAWSRSAIEEVSYGAPVFVQLPADVVSVTVSVESADHDAGYAWITNDGQTVLDFDHLPAATSRKACAAARRRGVSAPGCGRRAPRSTRATFVTDTWDTWWDTFAHTGDTGYDTWLPDSAWDSTDTAAYPWPGWYEAPFFHGPDLVGTFVLPITPDTTPRPGCLALQPVSWDELSGEPYTVHIATRTAPAAGRRLDVNVVVVDGAGITARQLQAAVDRMYAVYAGGTALDRGVVTVYDITLPGGAYVPANGPELNALRSTVTADEPDRALNLFFIADFTRAPGTLGISSGVPGPFALRETAASGVVLSVDAHRKYDGKLDIETLGETMAHEAGHQMGLFHTSEADGTSFDPLGDTPECHRADWDRDGNGVVYAPECHAAGGDNFMFWASSGWRQPQGVVSAEQALVLSSSPIAY